MCIIAFMSGVDTPKEKIAYVFVVLLWRGEVGWQARRVETRCTVVAAVDARRRRLSMSMSTRDKLGPDKASKDERRRPSEDLLFILSLLTS